MRGRMVAPDIVVWNCDTRSHGTPRKGYVRGIRSYGQYMVDEPPTVTEATMDTEDALAAMKASSGSVCFRYPSQGYYIYLRYAAADGRFERLRVVSDHPTESNDSSDSFRVHEYCYCSGEELNLHLTLRFDAADGGGTFSDFYSPVALPETPFPMLSESPTECTDLEG